MAIREATQAIIDVCTGESGSTRRVEYGVEFVADDPINVRIRSMLAPIVDVVVVSGDRHAASPLGVGTYEITTHKVLVALTHELRSEAVDAEMRKCVRADMTEALDTIVAALCYPGNLSLTADGRATGVVSGMMVGDSATRAPTWRVDGEDWDARVIRSVIEGRIIIQQTRQVVNG